MTKTARPGEDDLPEEVSNIHRAADFLNVPVPASYRWAQRGDIPEAKAG